MFDLYHDQIFRCTSMNDCVRKLHFLGAMAVGGVCGHACACFVSVALHWMGILSYSHIIGHGGLFVINTLYVVDSMWSLGRD
jgi:hypothetical protein